MEKKSKLKKFRLLFIGLVVIIFLLINQFPCILFHFSSLPVNIKTSPGKQEMVILYGTGLCLSCFSGQYLYRLREKTDLLLVVPFEFEDTDIQNLKDVFMLKGKVIRGNQEVVKWIKRLINCKGLEETKANFHLYVDEKGKPGSIKSF